MDDDVGSPLDRPAEVRRGERVVDRSAGVSWRVRDVGDCPEVEDIAARITDGLGE